MERKCTILILEFSAITACWEIKYAVCLYIDNTPNDLPRDAVLYYTHRKYKSRSAKQSDDPAAEMEGDQEEWLS